MNAPLSSNLWQVDSPPPLQQCVYTINLTLYTQAGSYCSHTRHFLLFCYSWYTRGMLGKYTTLFFGETLVDFNKPRLHEVTLNLHTHACIFSRLSIASVDRKQHLSEVVFSTLVGFSLYSTSTDHRVKQSPKSTTGMSSIAYVMLCGARDRSCQQVIGTSITTMLQHIPRR